MPREADVAVVRRLFCGRGGRRFGRRREYFRQDAISHVPGTSQLAGTHRGWPAIRDDFLAKLGPLSGGTFRAKVLDVGVGAEYIVSIGTGTAEHAGRRLNVTVCQFMRIQDGKIVEVRGHYSDEAALDAFWGTSSSAAR
jgi:hypothetical protein